jgi:hypothetical protein
MPVLGAACTRSQETVRVPDYDAGPFGLTLRVRVPLVDNAPSFNDAIDHAAFALANDGWMIESVSHCAVIGIADQGFAFFQVVVTATRS